MKSPAAEMKLGLLLLLLVLAPCFPAPRLFEYEYVGEERNWTEAQTYCRDKFTDLVSVGDLNSVRELNGSLGSVNKAAWIGLQRNASSTKVWLWSQPGLGFNLSHPNWTGPNDPGNQNCGGMCKNRKWLAVSCVSDQYFLCYNETEPSRFEYFLGEKRTWSDAQQFCRSTYTDLVSEPQLQQLWSSGASVTYIADNTKTNILDKLQESCSGRASKCYIFIGFFSDDWSWSNGDTFNFRFWSKTYDDDSGRNNRTRNCTVLNEDGTWINKVCSERNPFVCYKDHVHLIQQNLSWEDALYYCRERNQDLVTIRDLGEQRWVQEKVKSATTAYVWTGLRYTCTLGFWFWVSDERVGYQNWASSPAQVDGCDVSGAVDMGGKHQWVKKNDQEKLNFLCSDV